MPDRRAASGRLCRLAGVSEVTGPGPGDRARRRQIIAYVGADLVRWDGCRPTSACTSPTLSPPCSACSTGRARRSAEAQTGPRSTAMKTSAGRLIRAELKLMMRDPLTLTFVFAFPVVTMLIIGGSLGTTPDPGLRQGKSGPLVRGVVSDRDHRSRRLGNAAGAHGVLPGARGAAAVRGGGLPALVVRAGPARHRPGPAAAGGACCWRWRPRSTACPPLRTGGAVVAGLVAGAGAS